MKKEEEGERNDVTEAGRRLKNETVDLQIAICIKRLNCENLSDIRMRHNCRLALVR